MLEISKNLYALIFAGGGGTRLWPLSKEDRPKQFLKLFSKKSLIQETFERVKKTIPQERIYVITTKAYYKQVRRELRSLKAEQIIIEPEKRNTGPASYIGCLAISKINPSAVVAHIWVDHKIDDYKAYKEALLKGAEVALREEALLTVGLKPDFPHTGLGYLVAGERIEEDVFEVEKFVEKPPYETAKLLIDARSALWNVGVYIGSVKLILDYYKKYAPEIVENRDDYAKMPDISIDKALSERVPRLLVLAGKFDWSDVGDFEVLWEKLPEKDEHGNVVISKKGWMGVETQGSLLISETGQLITTVGLSNIAVIATKDSILVLPKDDSQRIKELIVKMRNKNFNKFL